MFGRILLACVLGLGVFAADTVSADSADGLYDALLKSIPTALPPGVGAAQTAPVSIDGDDQSAGVRGILQ